MEDARADVILHCHASLTKFHFLIPLLAFLPDVPELQVAGGEQVHNHCLFHFAGLRSLLAQNLCLSDLVGQLVHIVPSRHFKVNPDLPFLLAREPHF